MDRLLYKRFRGDLKYVLFLSITIILREAVSEIMNYFCCPNSPELLTTYLMFSGELFFGLVYYLSNIKTLFTKKKPKFMGIPLIIGVEKKKIVTLKLFFI